MPGGHIHLRFQSLAFFYRGFVIFLLFLCMSILSACGFHLRGMADVPTWLDNVAIVIETGHRDLEAFLKVNLEAYHIRVTQNPAEAHYWLIIEHDYEEEHITSVSSSTTPRQYQMTYRVRYKFQEAQGREIIPSCNVVVTRQITINNDRILGSNDEENILKKEMRRDAAIQILDRIANQTSKYHDH